MKVHCEICGVREGERVRAAEHTVLGEAIDIKLPLKGHMIGSPNAYRGVPAPFPSADDWKDMRCRRCGKIPFQFLPDDLDRYNEQGGPDRVYTDTGWYSLIPDESTQSEVGECPTCGKSESEFKNKAGFNNHMRFCARKHGR